MRESFFAGQAVLSKFLFGTVIPEVYTGEGFVDYKIGGTTRFIVLELKSLFDAEISGTGRHRELKALRRHPLEPARHRDQVKRYVDQGAEFVILSNLRDWHFYDDTVTTEGVEFGHANLHELAADFDVLGSLLDYLNRQQFQALGEDLDKKFFKSLQQWVAKLSEVQYAVGDQEKTELAIGILNKLIFVQTLDAYGVIDFRWLRSSWDRAVQMWRAKGKKRILGQFLREIDQWFFQYYDTELFRIDVLSKVADTPANWELLYRNLQLVLGFGEWQPALRGFRGISQYRYRYIDEDIFGKAYETFLGDVRHDEGIYYTPPYISTYIIEGSLGAVSKEYLARISKALERGDWSSASKAIDGLCSIRIVDPAYGSGSFLVKSLRHLYGIFLRVREELDRAEKVHAGFASSKTLLRSDRGEQAAAAISQFRARIGLASTRELIARIMVRHLFGNDLDAKSLEVAKVNLWLEAIKLSPGDFRFDQLPPSTNHILPDLRLNLTRGNSVVGLFGKDLVDELSTAHQPLLAEMSALLGTYLENPSRPELVDRIEEGKAVLRAFAAGKLKDWLTSKGLPDNGELVRAAFHWPVEFWFCYFDKNGKPLTSPETGFAVVVGNPPYERIQVIRKKSKTLADYLDGAGFSSIEGNYDMAMLFIERGFKLLRQGGKLGYIVTNKFIQTEYGTGIRRYLSGEKTVTELVDFGDQQIFEDATTYTALLLLTRHPQASLKYALIQWLDHTADQLHRIDSAHVLDDIDLIVFPVESSTLNAEPWQFNPAADLPILGKFAGLKTLESVAKEIFVGLQTSKDKVYIAPLREKRGALTRVSSPVLGLDVLLETKLLKPLLYGEEISRWITVDAPNVIVFPYTVSLGKVQLLDEEMMTRDYMKTWEYLCQPQVRNELEGREDGRVKGRSDWYGFVYLKNMDKFEQPKIITQVLSRHPCFSLDLEGRFYFVGGGTAGGYGVTLPEGAEISLHYLCALLNSSVLDWKLRKKTSRFQGGYVAHGQTSLEPLPIVIPKSEREKELANRIEGFVKEACRLVEMRGALVRLWDEWSDKLKNDDRVLMTILVEDAVAVRSGRSDATITSNVTFYPDQQQESLSRKYEEILAEAYPETNQIRVYGVTGAGLEVLLYQAEFRDSLVHEHLYQSCLRLTAGKRKVETLSDFLGKVVVPIIKPDKVEGVKRIARRVLDEFAKEYPDANGTGIHDLLSLDARLRNVEADLDGLVFTLYGLDRAHVHRVLKSLFLLPSEQDRILSAFDRLAAA